MVHKGEIVKKWYELDSLMPYHDLVGAIGFLLLVAGVTLLSPAAGLITSGGGLLGLAWLMGKSA